MADEDTTITLYTTAEVVETGLWCEHCALPSLVQLKVGWVGDNFTTGSFEAHACTECMTKTSTEE